MNLHSIVAPCVAAINPWLTASIQRSNGYTTGADGSRIPAYLPAEDVQVQRQALSYNDIAQVSGLNIQGTRCKIYLNGNWTGLVRSDQKGGDLITMPGGSVWLVAMVLENWSETDGWVALCCTLQNGS